MSNFGHQSFGKQFKHWRQSQGISAYRIAKHVGVNTSFISNIEAGRRPMSDALMKKIAAVPEFNISYETLQAWKINGNYDTQALEEAYKITFSDKPSGQPNGVPPLDGLYRFPLKMTVSAGSLQPKIEHKDPIYVDWYDLKPLPLDVFCIKVSGDSMWPPIPNGAILLVREVDTLKNGEKYVIETEDEQMTFKLIQLDKTGAHLVPLNPQYEAIPLGQAQFKRLFQVLAYKVDWT